MTLIHAAIDRSGRETWRYERVAGLVVETWLLVGCAFPLVTDSRSALAQFALGTLRLTQAELARERASIETRARERGHVRRDLPAHKVARLARLAAIDGWIAWTWPAAAVAVVAIQSGQANLVAILGLLATLLRAMWVRHVLPTWRDSRVAWRTSRAD